MKLKDVNGYVDNGKGFSKHKSSGKITKGKVGWT